MNDSADALSAMGVPTARVQWPAKARFTRTAGTGATHRDKRRLYFLRHAATVRRNGQSETESIWLQAAAHLHGIDDDPVGALTQMLIAQTQYASAITLADVFAQLRPDDVASSFRLGYVLQMVNRRRDALAPYRQALTIDPGDLLKSGRRR
ncbi:hypothetical protein [Paraburkholderia kirstenboschensis]|uniref:hypothetical protein n=1 Tax=Paraburkholderia kirstenboschensis TaxID=1245436 RepID=UPI00191979FC|nr:hypothetical protein [Paraburkholderia kirstenboschensis]